MKKLPIIIFLAGLTILQACNKDDDENPNPNPSGELTVNFSNLAATADNEAYEGWIIVDGAPISTGTFTVDNSGLVSQNTFSVSETDLNAATDFVLSLEPVPDSDPAPSAIKVAGGSFSGGSAQVSASHGAALGNDFSSASGSYILATPTTSTTDDELSGVWFLDLSSGSPMAGLSLPVLPAGWIYEGWAVVDGNPVSTGTFSAASGSDNMAPYSGMDADAPPFPGEDFVLNSPEGLSFPVDLTGATMVISIEPSPDNSPAPFMFKPLAAQVAADAIDHQTYPLNNNVTGSFPTGTVMR